MLCDKSDWHWNFVKATFSANLYAFPIPQTVSVFGVMCVLGDKFVIMQHTPPCSFHPDLILSGYVFM